MTAPAIGVLSLQGDVAEHRAALTRAGATVIGVRRPAELNRVDGLLIPGGESTTIDKLLRALDLMDPLRERIRAGLPVYGSCAGMILLADHIEDGQPGQQTVGGIDMVVRRNGFGRQVDSFEAEVDIPWVGAVPCRAVFIRAPWVERVGADVEVLGRIEGGPASGRIVAVRQGALVATSFHPEITDDYRFHDAFVELVTATMS